MTICSYVIHPARGREQRLVKRLNGTPGCAAALADDRSIVLLVTETSSSEEEERLQKDLDAMKEIAGRALAFAARPSLGFDA